MKTILVIDDEEMTRELVARMIRRKGFGAMTAGDGQEGITSCKAVHPDAVFLDIMLPDMHGEQVYKAIKEIDKDIKVYFISASDYELQRLHAIGIRGDGYFSKPVNVVDDLGKILDSLKK